MQLQCCQWLCLPPADPSWSEVRFLWTLAGPLTAVVCAGEWNLSVVEFPAWSEWSTEKTKRYGSCDFKVNFKLHITTQTATQYKLAELLTIIWASEAELMTKFKIKTNVWVREWVRERETQREMERDRDRLTLWQTQKHTLTQHTNKQNSTFRVNILHLTCTTRPCRQFPHLQRFDEDDQLVRGAVRQHQLQVLVRQLQGGLATLDELLVDQDLTHRQLGHLVSGHTHTAQLNMNNNLWTKISHNLYIYIISLVTCSINMHTHWWSVCGPRSHASSAWSSAVSTHTQW